MQRLPSLTPPSNRITVADSTAGVMIQIAVQRSGCLIAFLSVWLWGWLLGMMGVLRTIQDLFMGQGHSLNAPLAFFCIAWPLGGLFFLWQLLWMLFGKHLMYLREQEVVIRRMRILGRHDEVHLRSSITEFRAEERVFRSRYGSWNGWVCCFDSAGRTVTFGDALELAEAEHLARLASEYLGLPYRVVPLAGS